jgi:hypothetical protein
MASTLVKSSSDSGRGIESMIFGYHKMGISCPAFGGSKKTLFLVMEFLPTSWKLLKHGSG